MLTQLPNIFEYYLIVKVRNGNFEAVLSFKL